MSITIKRSATDGAKKHETEGLNTMDIELTEYHNPTYTGTHRRQTISCKELLPLPGGEEIASFTIHGNCMEGSGIYDGDSVIVDFDRFPRIGDACICAIDNKLMVKRYEGRIGKRVFSVGTNYDFGGKAWGPNFEFNGGAWIEKIYGAVFACLSPEQSLRWKVDPLTLPKEPGEIIPQRGNLCFNCFVK